MKDHLLGIVSSVSDSGMKANVMREYLQIYALRALFERGRFGQVAFVGGTALRFIFGVPRFSEDLDFSLVNKEGYDFGQMLSEIKRSFENANYAVSVKFKSEKTVNTALLKFPEILHLAGLSHRANQNLTIKIDVDTNPPKGGALATSLINKYFPVTFTHYDLPSLFAGKLSAIFTRPYVKGRDYFDLVWLLGRFKGLEPNFTLLNNALLQTGNSLRVTPSDWKRKVLEKIESVSWQGVIDDVKRFSEDPLFIESMKPEYVKSLLV